MFSNLKNILDPNVFLSVLSFLNGFVLPVPPDPLMMGYCVKSPKNWWKFAIICILFTSLGGVLSFYIGEKLMNTFGNQIISFYHLELKFITIQEILQKYGVYIVSFLSLAPFPFLLVGMACGFFKYSFLIYIIGSFLGKIPRYFGLAYVSQKFHGHFKVSAKKNIILIGILILSVIIGFLLLKLI